MTEKQLKGYVLRLFKYKSISPKQFMIARSNLEKIKESDPFFYYFNMGKLQTVFGNVDEAILFLNKAIELKPNYASAYYNLYKCYVKKNNINAALKNIEEVFKYTDKSIDFSFPIQIIRTMQLLDINYVMYLNSNFKVFDEAKVGYNDLRDNQKLAEVYKLAIQSFNNRDYIMCLKKLHVMNMIINEINYPMEVDTLISLVRLLKSKEVNSCKRALYDKSIEKSSDENFSKFQIRLFELGYYNPESYLRMSKEIIDNDILKGKKILDEACQNQKFSPYLDVIEYLNGIIKEKSVFMSLSEENKEEFTSRRLKAKRLYKNKHNDRSLEEYSTLKEEFKLPICDYYIGKILFRQGEFTQAKEAFLRYLEQGGEKTEKVYIFLGEIEKKQKNINEAKRYFDMSHRIKNMFICFDYMSDKNYIKKGFEADDKDQYDVVKVKKSRNIKMNEEDFVNANVIELGNFYEVGLSSKLSIIRNLLQNGNNKLANKLYEEVQRECAPEERSEVMQFGRNRKIYRNQNRTY